MFSTGYLPGFRERVGAITGSAASAIWCYSRNYTTPPPTVNPTQLTDRLIELKISVPLNTKYKLCLQCFDTAGWAAGRASGL